MIANDVLDRALVLLNYTTPFGNTDNRLNQEQIRRALPVIHTVLWDMGFILHKPLAMPQSLADPMPLPDDICMRVVVPGVAMYLAQGINDADSYNRFALEYAEKRRTVYAAPVTVQDVQPYPVL